MLESSDRDRPRPLSVSTSLATWIAAIIVFLLIGTSAMLYRSWDSAVRQEAYENLRIVSSLKTAQIVQWRLELMGNAQDLASQVNLADAVFGWLRNRNDKDWNTVVTSLKTVKRRAHLNDVMLVDASRHLRINLLGHLNYLDVDDQETLESVFHEPHTVVSNIHAHRENGGAHLDVIAPLVASGHRLVGAVILEADAVDFLDPILASWPTASRSAETLLVRRVGDSVEFLTATRHRPDSALRLRIPLTRTDVPAVRAVLHNEDTFEGVDYRGEPVFSVLRAIPDAPWFLVTKIDKAEALSEWRTRSQLLLLLLVTLISTTVGGLLWIRKNAASYKELCLAEAALRRQRAHLEKTVVARTQELKVRNDLLAAEIKERMAAESRLASSNKRLADLTSEQAEHLRLLAQELAHTEQRERDKLQERLHDEVQPLLVAARLALSGISEDRHGSACAGLATEAREHIGKVLATARDLSAELSPPLLRERGLGPAFEVLGRLMQTNYALSVDFAFDPDAEPPNLATRLLCFNATRELLMNVVKHAETKFVELNMELERPELLRISVIDRGRGFVPVSDSLCNGSGLPSIERRLKMIGGRLTIVSKAGAGTTAIIRVPIQPMSPQWENAV